MHVSKQSKLLCTLPNHSSFDSFKEYSWQHIDALLLNAGQLKINFLSQLLEIPHPTIICETWVCSAVLSQLCLFSTLHDKSSFHLLSYAASAGDYFMLSGPSTHGSETIWDSEDIFPDWTDVHHTFRVCCFWTIPHRPYKHFIVHAKNMKQPRFQ